MGKDELINEIVELAENNVVGGFNDSGFSRDLDFLLADYELVAKERALEESSHERAALPLHDVNGSALEADYWSNRCKIVESIWENSNVEYIDEELGELEKEYRAFIKQNGSKHYR